VKKKNRTFANGCTKKTETKRSLKGEGEGEKKAVRHENTHTYNRTVLHSTTLINCYSLLIFDTQRKNSKDQLNVKIVVFSAELSRILENVLNLDLFSYRKEYFHHKYGK